MHRDDTIRKPLNAPSSRELSSEARLRELHRVCPRSFIKLRRVVGVRVSGGDL